MLATCPTHCTLLDFNVLIIFAGSTEIKKLHIYFANSECNLKEVISLSNTALFC
jgi:hypothetical protein